MSDYIDEIIEEQKRLANEEIERRIREGGSAQGWGTHLLLRAVAEAGIKAGRALNASDEAVRFTLDARRELAWKLLKEDNNNIDKPKLRLRKLRAKLREIAEDGG